MTVTLSIPAAQTLQEILLKASAKGLQNLHRAALVEALKKPIQIFETAREGLVTEYAKKDAEGKPIVLPGGNVMFNDVRAFQKALEELATAQSITIEPLVDPHIRDGLRFAKSLVTTDACPALDGVHAFNFKAVYDALITVE